MALSDKIYLGIDPGPVNTGWCARGVIDGDSFLSCGVFDPRATGDVIMSAETMWHELHKSIPERKEWTIHSAAIERFVSYKGVLTNNVEDTCFFIGSLTFLLRSKGIKTTLARAITWKPKVCSSLHLTKGFENPSPKLDKRFSMAAASCISGASSFKERPFKTDHEADAIGLSYFAEHFT